MSSFKCLDCGVEIPGTNCAYTLSRAMGWRMNNGCYYHCTCGYPVRSKEIRDNIFNNELSSDKNSSDNAFIYCETDSGGGHVYYGTFYCCVIGNGLSASGMSSCNIFRRFNV